MYQFMNRGKIGERRLRDGRLLLVCVLGLLFCAGSAYGQSNEEILEELQRLRERVSELEHKLEAQQEQHETEKQDVDRRLEEMKEEKPSAAAEGPLGVLGNALGDIDMSIGATAVVQGTLGADEVNPEGDVTDASYSVDIDFTAPVGENGQLYLYLEGGEGAGVTDELPSLTGVNYDALADDADIQISEVWYQHRFFEDRLTLNAGKMWSTRWFDSNEVANDETSQFLSTMFRNNIAVEWPGGGFYAPGVRLGYQPTEWLQVQGGVFDTDSDFESIGDDVFGIAEVDLMPRLLGRQGNYRFYVWYNDSRHQEWRKNIWRDYSDDPDLNEENMGFGLSFDQELTDCVTVFARYGFQDEDVAPIDWSWSVGFQSTMGWLCDREEDVLGFAAGQAILSDAYKDAFAPQPVTLALRGLAGLTGRYGGQPDKDEFHLETYYNYRVNKHLSVSPSLQYVANAGGLDETDDVFILGTRFQVSF